MNIISFYLILFTSDHEAMPINFLITIDDETIVDETVCHEDLNIWIAHYSEFVCLAFIERVVESSNDPHSKILYHYLKYWRTQCLKRLVLLLSL